MQPFAYLCSLMATLEYLCRHVRSPAGVVQSITDEKQQESRMLAKGMPEEMFANTGSLPAFIHWLLPDLAGAAGLSDASSSGDDACLVTHDPCPLR